MQQYQSQEKHAPISQPAATPQSASAERAGSHDSTASSNYSETIREIEDDIDALVQEVDRLGKEFIESTEEYNSSLSKFRQRHTNDRARIFKTLFAKFQDISVNSKPEDMRKEAAKELRTAAKNRLGGIRGRIDEQAKELENEDPNKTIRSNLNDNRARHNARQTIKASTIKGNPEEIKRVAGTSEGMAEIEKCRKKLEDAYKLVEMNARNSYEEYIKKLNKIGKHQEHIKGTLDRKNIPQGSEDRASIDLQFNRLGSRHPDELMEYVQKTIKGDDRMDVLKK